MDSAVAASHLTRGVELDLKGKYSDALICYQHGIEELLKLMKDAVGEQLKYLRAKIEEYMSRAEKIKKIINERKTSGKSHEQIEIAHNATGYSYKKVFGRFLGSDVVNIIIEDPYIRAFYQAQNLVKCFELFVSECPKLMNIKLLTKRAADTEQNVWLNQIKGNLAKHDISLEIEYSDTLHDRKIELSNGWIIKIGRGLDYFKAPEFNLALGTFDMDMRKCHETTIDIFNSKDVKNL